MDLHPSLVFLGGLMLLIVGAEFILRPSSRIAGMLGLKPIIIGLTVVSVGTSMPELAVGITAVREGKGALAVGNIAGTNIVNILFILGLSAAIRPLKLQLLSLKLDVPVMIASAVALFLMALNGVLSRLEGLILFSAAIVYSFFLIRLSKKETARMRKEYEEEFPAQKVGGKQRKWAMVSNLLLLALGIAMAIVGADFLVSGAVSIAESLGVSDAIIGLTIVRSEEHTSELQSRENLVCRLLLEKKK